MELALIDPRTDARYASELDLRYRMLRAPLGLSRDEVTFEGEDEALHVVAATSGAVEGCVLFDLASGRLRAMAVDTAQQRSGLGSRLVEKLEAELRLRGIAEVTLHARADVVGFYERLGYRTLGEPFTEVGVVHRTMNKRLSPAELPPAP